MQINGLRAAVAGLAAFAAAQEQTVLAAAPDDEDGHPSCWAALPLVAHNTEFRRQQVVRLRSIRAGRVPPEFTEADHQSAELYAELCAQPFDAVAGESWRVTGELIAELGLVSLADLTDPSRHPWLRGRQLWLQVVVRGFWHPAGHLGEYYVNHGQADRAIALARQAVATAAYLGASDPARGMASYNLACALAGAGLTDEAAAAVAEAIDLNADLRLNAARDADLAAVRAQGRLAAVLS
jgi:hypothetical protein